MYSLLATIRNKNLWCAVALLVLILAGVSFGRPPQFVNAETAAELQAKIEKRNADIAALEKEIKAYQIQIDSLATQADSLSATIKSLDLTQKKLAADISLTQDKISAKNLQIQQLSGQIVEKEGTISDNKRIIAQSMSKMNQLDGQSTPELLLMSSSLSSAWDALENLGTLQSQLQNRILNLREVKAGLETNKLATEKAKGELVTLQNQLGDQRKVVVSTANQKTALLNETKQSEANYAKLVANKKALKAAYEKEVLLFESALKIAIDPNSIPKTGTGVLIYPLDKVIITQYFGNTTFATANPQIYSGSGQHGGIDFGTSIGTPIKAAASGKVTRVGNTDVGRCLSYGKWIMIQHPNGLSTLYGHLSVQSVVTGQDVSVGDVIGYSGNTGLSTGPHLHFGVYATQGVRITKNTGSANCSTVDIPYADLKAYLNPLSYL